jgi:hypothetical protein
MAEINHNGKKFKISDEILADFKELVDLIL